MASIASSVSSLVAGLTPALGGGVIPSGAEGEGQKKFRVASGMRDWDDRPDSDKDREFTVDYGMVNDALTIGRTTDQLFTGELQLRIGHAKQVSGGGYYGETSIKYSTIRRDYDLELISMKIQNPANYTSGCCLIVKSGEAREEQERHWVTTLTFDVTYLGTAIGQ